MIAAMGRRKTAYAFMKFRKLPALFRIFHGTSAHATTAQISWPLRMLTKRGNSAVRSLAADSELAEMLTPSAARAKLKAPKKRHARLSQCEIRAIGSQFSSLYLTAPAEEAAMPMKAMNVKTRGRKGT